jgi:hypothetical protein
MTSQPCAWCGAPVPPSRGSTPRLYCSAKHRQLQARYLERLPAWEAQIAEYESSAQTYRRLGRPLPTFLVNALDELRRTVARRGSTQ